VGYSAGSRSPAPGSSDVLILSSSLKASFIGLAGSSVGGPAPSTSQPRADRWIRNGGVCRPVGQVNSAARVERQVPPGGDRLSGFAGPSPLNGTGPQRSVASNPPPQVSRILANGSAHWRWSGVSSSRLPPGSARQPALLGRHLINPALRPYRDTRFRCFRFWPGQSRAHQHQPHGHSGLAEARQNAARGRADVQGALGLVDQASSRPSGRLRQARARAGKAFTDVLHWVVTGELVATRFVLNADT